MPDAITGVVVLQRMPEPGIWRLWFQYTRNDGIIGYSTIPMKPKSDPQPPDHKGPLWDFVLRNPFIDCSPSVRILGPHDGAPDHFHNSGQWSNPCVIMAKPYGSDPEARDVLRTINETSDKDKQDAVIFRARAEGILE